MKKIIIPIMLSLVLLGCEKQPVNDIPPEDNSIKEPAKIVSISNDMGTNDITIDDIVIKDVIIVNNNEKQQVEFTLESEKPLTTMTIEVSLLNETVVNRKMKLNITKEEYSKFIVFDFTGDYNNPYQIYFNIEK